MEWTREQRYRRLSVENRDEIRKLAKKISLCPYRQGFHIQPVTGLLNDPNGFHYYEGEFHLFYQWFPFGAVHGLKYWYHTKSKDLVHWENVGIGMEPDRDYDSHGVYSGSAVEEDGKLFLMYTGNTRDERWVRHPYQCMAVMDKTGRIDKFDHPVIGSVPFGYTDHFRDPKIWKEDGVFYAVIGAQRSDETGCAVLYRSADLKEWTFEGEIRTALKTFGYMWECPDYFELQQQGVLMFSPQGLAPEGNRFRNIFQSGYVIGDPLDLKTRQLAHGPFHELDRGFDFYAPQTTLAPDGRRLLVGWMGLPEIDYPTDESGWAHCLTLPRELSVRNGRLIQQPVKELEALRKTGQEAEDVLCSETKLYPGLEGTRFELICEFQNDNASEFGIVFRAKGKEQTVLSYDAFRKELTLNRSRSGQPVGKDYGTTRSCGIDSTSLKLHLFVDTSSVEVFVNDGEEVFTGRIFPRPDSREIHFFAYGGQAAFHAKKWEY